MRKENPCNLNCKECKESYLTRNNIHTSYICYIIIIYDTKMINQIELWEFSLSNIINFIQYFLS